jgi:hypothetical protein
MSADYGDDRYGLMRVHIAAQRARWACDKFSRNFLREWAKEHGVSAAHRLKFDLAWHMAQHGLIDAEGNLRDGFPGGAS